MGTEAGEREGKEEGKKKSVNMWGTDTRKIK